MAEVLHKLFKTFLNGINNALSTLEESGSKVSHFITEPRNFVEVTRLPAHVKKATLKATLKYISNM